MPQDLSDKSTLVQVMAWCRQATSHYLNQYWPRSLPPYGVTRPQWVKAWAKWMILRTPFFLNVNYDIFLQISLKFNPKGHIDNMSRLVKVMTRHQTSIKLWPEPMVTKIYTAILHDYCKISNISHTKSPNLTVSRLVLQLSMPNPMKPGVKSRMKI